MAVLDSLSDLNVSTQKARVVSRSRGYCDLDLSLSIHPDFHDIVPLTDTDAVRNSVRHLVLTCFGERPFQPDIEAGIRELLFEPADKFTMICLRDCITRVLSKYEPRIDSLQVQILDNSDQNRYDITISFRVITHDDHSSITLKLERIR